MMIKNYFKRLFSKPTAHPNCGVTTLDLFRNLLRDQTAVSPYPKNPHILACMLRFFGTSVPCILTARDSFKRGLFKKSLFFCGAASCLSLVFLPSAWAIGDQAPLDLNRFLPAPGAQKILTVEMADVGAHLNVVPQFFIHYANTPLVYSFGDKPLYTVVRDRVTTDLSLSLSLFERLQIALQLPITWYQHGDTIAKFPSDIGLTPPPQPATLGQEDLRLRLKALIWHNQHVGVGVGGDLALPTGNANSYLGSRLPTFDLQVLAHVVYGRFKAALNLGWLLASQERLLTTQTGMGLTFGLGAEVQVANIKNQLPLSVLAELYGVAHQRFKSIKESPIEASLAVKAMYHAWAFYLGSAFGVTSGYGEPQYRLFAGFSYSFLPAPKPVEETPKKAPASAPASMPASVPATRSICQGVDCPTSPQQKPIVKVTQKSNKIDLSERVFFDFDKDTIKSVSFDLLDEVANVILLHEELGIIRVEGHTDALGTDQYNQDLSARRAASVVRYLVEKGVPRSRLNAKGFGELCPLVDNDTEDNRAQNRRVDFIIESRTRVDQRKCSVMVDKNENNPH